MKLKILFLLILIVITGSVFAQKSLTINQDLNANGKSGTELRDENTAPANPEYFTIRFTCYFIKLTWATNQNDDPVIIAYNSVNKFGTPVNGKEYEEGDILPDGGKIIYSGNCSHFRHFNPPSDKCYYKIWSVNKNFIYSIGIESTCIDESLINSIITFINRE